MSEYSMGWMEAIWIIPWATGMRMNRARLLRLGVKEHELPGNGPVDLEQFAMAEMKKGGKEPEWLEKRRSEARSR